MGLKKRSVTYLTNLYQRLVKEGAARGLTKPSAYTTIRRRGLEIVYLLILFGLAAGVVNAALEGSKPNFLNAIIIPSRAAESWSEAFINFFTIMLGTFGIYLMYQSGRQRGRVSDTYLLLGVVLLILAAFMGFALLAQKGF